MSSALIAPETETFPNRYRWTTEACYRLMDLGVLDGRFELLDGEIIDKMGQKPPHSVTLTRVAKVLAALFGLDRLRVQSPITLPGTLGVYNEPEPDVVVTQETEDRYAERHPSPTDVLLLIEVSDTTARTDLVLKARLYARSEIKEYWVLNLAKRQLHVFREPANGKYARVTIHKQGESVGPLERPDATIQVTSLLPPK